MGAIPLFINIEKEIKILKLSNKKIFELKNKKKIKIENNKIIEARAWTKKYFNEDSVENKFFDLIIRGIKDNRLISKPIQILNHEVEEIVIKVPIIKVEKNKNLWEFLIIKKKKIKTSIIRVWT